MARKPIGLLRRAGKQKRVVQLNSLHDAMHEARDAVTEAYKPLVVLKSHIHRLEEGGENHLTDEDRQILDALAVNMRQMSFLNNRLFACLNGDVNTRNKP